MGTRVWPIRNHPCYEYRDEGANRTDAGTESAGRHRLSGLFVTSTVTNTGTNTGTRGPPDPSSGPMNVNRPHIVMSRPPTSLRYATNS